MVPIFPHLFFKRGQQGLQLLLAVQAWNFSCCTKQTGSASLYNPYSLHGVCCKLSFPLRANLYVVKGGGGHLSGRSRSCQFVVAASAHPH